MCSIVMKTTRLSSSELRAISEGVICHLAKYKGVGVETCEYIRKHNVHLKFSKLIHSAAAWTFGGNIQLDIERSSGTTLYDDQYLLSLVVHETCHLKQGFLTALSVYGELNAWQVGFRFFKEISGVALHPVIEEVLDLPLNWSRENLSKAALLMKRVSPVYRIDLLPLYPIHQELLWRLFRKVPNNLRSTC